MKLKIPYEFKTKKNFASECSELESKLVNIAFSTQEILTKNMVKRQLVRLKEIESKTKYFLGLAFIPTTNFEEMSVDASLIEENRDDERSPNGTGLICYIHETIDLNYIKEFVEEYSNDYKTLKESSTVQNE